MFCAAALQVMWAYATAACNIRSLVRAAAGRAVVLGHSTAFSSTRQPLALLNSLQALRGLQVEVHDVLMAELKRLKQLEGSVSVSDAKA